MKYWLFKTEPNVYSIDDLKKAKKDDWDGVIYDDNDYDDNDWGEEGWNDDDAEKELTNCVSLCHEYDSEG